MSEAANERDAYREAGVVTTDEALEILSRFVASHFRKTDRERARFSIPANPRYDDDIRMGAFIRSVAAARDEGAEGVVHDFISKGWIDAEVGNELVSAIRANARGEYREGPRSLDEAEGGHER